MSRTGTDLFAENAVMDPRSFYFPRFVPHSFNTGTRSSPVIGYFGKRAGQLADLSINSFNVLSTGIFIATEL